MNREAVTADVWRVLLAIEDAKFKGCKEVTVNLQDLQGFTKCADEVERLECVVERLEEKLDDKNSELSRLEDDVIEAQEEVAEMQLKMASANVRLNKLRELVNNIEL